MNLLQSQLTALPVSSIKLIIDNASGAKTQQHLRILAVAVANVHLVTNTTNVGLAAAVNQAVAEGRQLAPKARYCLLLDQDSEPQAGSVNQLVSTFENLETQGIPVGCVGPLLIDAVTTLPHGFHQARGGFWRRIYPDPLTGQPVPCTNLNGSGTLVPIDVFTHLGGLDEAMFIDHVDTEWSFRVLASGLTLWGVPQAQFQHRMGQDSLRYWLFGWRVWPARSSLRHHYLFRNAVWLMRRPYVPGVWKFWAVIKLSLTFIVHGLFDVQRKQQLLAMLQGLRVGLCRDQSETISRCPRR